MEALVLVTICAVGTLFPPMNPEFATAAFAARSGWHPVVVGLLAAGGQTVTYAGLYFLGARLLPRWPWLARQVDAIRLRFKDHLERRYLLVAVAAGALGLPPAAGLSAMASGFGIPARHVLPVIFVARAVRASAVAAFGQSLFAWWNAA